MNPAETASRPLIRTSRLLRVVQRITRKSGPPCPPIKPVSGPMGLEAEVESGAPLEHQAALHAIGLAPDDDQGSPEAEHVEIVLQLARVPNLAVLLLQILTA